MDRILFLHGFFASGSCVPAKALEAGFSGRAEVLTPDLPLHPQESLAMVADICRSMKPKVIVGNSCGAFLAQIVASRMALPALLGNPYFEMTKFLEERLGRHHYRAVRRDGRQEFVVDRRLIDEFRALQQTQFDCCSPENGARIWGLFGDNDRLAHYEPMFLQHYGRAFHFPGEHTPTAEETLLYYVPLAERLMEL